MALNMPVFKTRAISAILFASIMLFGLLWNEWSFFLLFTIIHFGCWKEYFNIMGLIFPKYKQISTLHQFLVMFAGWGLMLWMSSDGLYLGSLRIHELGWWMLLTMIIVLPIIEVLLSDEFLIQNLFISFAGLLYISLAWGLMMDLRGMFEGGINIQDFFPTQPWAIPILLIACIWINDTMAYITGSLFGKTPLSSISPKKTWEGTIGGAVLCVGLAYVTMHYLFQANTQHVMAIAAIAAVIGTLGDLLESKLKRLAQLKDSGNMMPGHGGFLDRFDSLLLATPFVWLYAMLFMY